MSRLTFWLKLWALLLRAGMRIVAVSVLAFFTMAGVVIGLFGAHGLDRLGFPPLAPVIVSLCAVGAIGGAWLGWPVKIWRLARTLRVHEGPRVLWRRHSPATQISERQNPAAYAALRVRLVAIPGSSQYEGREALFRDPTTGHVWRYSYIEEDFSHDEVLVRMPTHAVPPPASSSLEV